MRTTFSIAILAGICFSAAAASAAEPTVAELVAGLKSPDEAARITTIDELGGMGAKAAEAVPALAELLKNPSPAVRAHAAQTLGAIGEAAKPIVPELVKLMADSERTVRREALEALARIRPGPRVGVPLFVKLMENSDPEARHYALMALTDAGGRAVPFLLEALKSEKATYWACLVLGQIGPDARDAVPALTALIADKRPEVRREAILALASIGPDAAKSAIPQIAKAIDDDHANTAAIYALGMLGEAPADVDAKIRKQVESPDKVLASVSIWTLARLHRDDKKLLREASKRLVEGLKDTDPQSRAAAAKALASLRPGPDIFLPVLEEALKNADENVVREALDALAGLGPAAVPKLIAALKYEGLRRNVVYMLGQQGPAAKPAVEALVKLLDDTDADVRHETAIALAKIGPDAKAAVPALVKIVEEEDRPFCSGAAFALGRIGSPEAVPALMKALESDDDALASISAWALVQIQPKDAKTAEKVVPILNRALGSPNPKFRRGAAEALKKIGAPAKSTIPALKKLLNDEDKSVRTMAEEAIAAIAG